mgnify:CR=1 FL=1
MNVPRPDRLAEFLRRLRQAPPAQDGQEAFEQIAAILNAVEDELTDIPYDPDRWMNDGRMYPPQRDSGRSELGGVIRFRSRGHNTFVGPNGAIEIRRADEERTLELRKAGADGQHVRDGP